MGGNTLDMTKGSAWKLIVQFAVPVFLSQVFQQLYNTADALIVGRFLGDEALAAVSASGPLIFLLISFFTGLSMGAGVTISRYFGAGDYDRVSRAIHTDVMLGLLSGVILTVVGVWLTPTFLRWMGTAPEVLPDAIAYFRYYFIGVLAVVMYNMCKSIMNALGDSKRPLYYLIISSSDQYRARSAVHRRVPLGRVGGGRRHDDLAGRQHDPVHDPPDEEGYDLSGRAEKAAHRPRNARPDRPLRPAVRRAELLSSALPTSLSSPTSTPSARSPWRPTARTPSWRASRSCPSPASPWR
ncbi:MAG: MATE family efflux transporter [Acutalibacteraceae bacterium]